VKPFISVIIPVYNASEFLNRCLTAIKKSSYTFYEVIVVDDNSTDESAETARKNDVKVFRLQHQSGPAIARNYGAQKAKGEVLLFIDSDVLVKEQTLARVAEDFTENPDIAAVFGSYDDDPAEKNFLSQYKNLVHHYVHQQSRSEAATFWAGCGAIRKDVFHEVGGFDGTKYSRPCIEDIELGYRLKKMGYRILLDKDLQVKHLKEWRLKSWLRTDIFSRAVPWTKLILESQEIVTDLNLQPSQKLSAALLGLSLLALAFSFISHQLLYVVVISLALIFLINHKLFSFFFKLKGFKFVILAFLSQLLYYFYSSVVFVSCWCNYKFLRKIVS
jgi:glycosyltransferase involved in cell wall biosynthesis